MRRSVFSRKVGFLFYGSEKATLFVTAAPNRMLRQARACPPKRRSAFPCGRDSGEGHGDKEGGGAWCASARSFAVYCGYDIFTVAPMEPMTLITPPVRVPLSSVK